MTGDKNQSFFKLDHESESLLLFTCSLNRDKKKKSGSYDLEALMVFTLSLGRDKTFGG